MSESHSGGCACGAIRYEAIGAPVAQVHCQCRHCQLRSGTGHSSYMVFAGAEAVNVSGETKNWMIAGDSGNMKAHAFCPTCGTPVFVTFPSAPQITALHAGSLDDPGRFAPEAVTYTSMALSWDLQDAALAAFERMPPS